jgi:hypothetical protein
MKGYAAALIALAVTWVVAMVEPAIAPRSASSELTRVPYDVDAWRAATRREALLPPGMSGLVTERAPVPPMIDDVRERRAPDRDDDPDAVAEKTAMRTADHSPEQGEWRKAWSIEQPDPCWTQQIAAELRAKTQAFLHENLALSDLDCRETVCRMELQFADQRDEQALMSAPHDPAQKYEYQSTDPVSHSYELLIKRPELAYLPPVPEDMPPRPATSADEIAILSPRAGEK